MKRTITITLCSIVLALANFWAVFAQPGTYYKVHYINQPFDEIDVLPTGWSVRNAATGTVSNLGRNGGMAIAEKTGGGKWLSFNGSGSGSRGSELVFPSTTTYAAGYPNDSIWNIEFDWTLVTTAASLSPKNALAIVLAGSNGVPTNDAGGWYLPGIFGLYVWKDGGFMHYMNQDRDGLPKRDASGNLIPGETNGVAIPAGNSQSWRRATATDPATQSPVGTADSLNAPSATNVTIALGGTYHITASIDFKAASQKVLSIIITDVANPANADTIEGMAFLAPTYAGTTSTVLPENRIVKDMAVFSTINTRGSNGGNGNSANFAGSGIDNLEIYVWKESVGIADVTVNYLDQNDQAVKAARVVTAQQVGSSFSLVTADKEKVVDATNYFAYDADATHLANAAKGTGENLTVDFANNSLAVKFKKSAKTDGNYVWTGATNGLWNELSDNFSVNGGAAQSYQAGNAALFSDAAAVNKTIVTDGTIDLGASDITVTAADYTFKGIGKLLGTGSFSVLASSTLGVDNRLVGGVNIGTADVVNITSPAAGTSFKAITENVNLKLIPGAAFSKAISGSAGTLNLTTVSDVAYSSAITGFSTVNITLPTVGRETGNSWTNPFTTAFEAGTMVNIIDATAQDTVTTYLKYRGATYAINNNSLTDVKVHLGDNTRIILNSTPGGNSTTSITIGEVTGTASSTIQGNCVSGDYTRIVEYAIGGANTDATFDGSIIPQLTREPGRRSGTEKIWTRLTTPGDTTWFIPSTLKIKKVGTGKWTLGGKIIIPDETSPSTVTVSGGTLELKDSIVVPGTNIMTLTVDPSTTLKANYSFVGMYNINVNGTLEDGIRAGANLTINKTATVKLDVANFTDNFEKVEVAGDLVVDSATLEINVSAPLVNKGDKVTLFTSSNPNIRFRTVYVNGDMIVSDGVPVAGKNYIWVKDEDNVFTGELLFDGVTGIKDNFASKEIKNIKYFDLTGRPVNKITEKTEGVFVKKTTYTDGSVRTEKTYIRRK